MNSIVEKLARIAARSSPEDISQKTTESDIQLQVEEMAPEGGFQVLILGAGRMCEPAVKYLASTGRQFGARKSSWVDGPVDERVWVVVASLFLEDAQKVRKKFLKKKILRDLSSIISSSTIVFVSSSFYFSLL